MRFGGFLVVFAAALALVGVFLAADEVAGGLGQVASALFTLFEDKSFPLLLAGAILAVAAVLFVVYGLSVVLPQVTHLKNLRRLVQRHEGEEGFAGAFESVSNRLGESPVIGHSWKEFHETLVMPDGKVSVIQNTTRPHNFINIRCAQDRSLALRLMPHLPNYFVGVGLLLTFVGLVAALDFATRTVGGDINEAIQGLENLLAAATFKFWTSIAGLLASIVLSFAFRLYNLWLEGCFAALCHAIEERLTFSTPQRIFFDVRDTVREQLDETKKINTEMAMSIADGVGRQFREQVPPILTESLKPLVQAVEESAKRTQEGASGSMERMVGQFAETIEGSAGQHLKEVSSTLERLSVSLEQMQGSMDTSGSAFAERMADGSERLNGTMQEVARAMREMVDELKNEVGDAGSRFGDSLEESLRRMAEQSEALSERLSRQSESAAGAFAEQLAEAAQALKSSANESAQTSAGMAEQIRASLGDSTEGVQVSLEKLRITLEEVDGRLQRQSGELSRVVERSRETAEAMSAAAGEVRGGLAPFQEVGRTMADSAQNLERSVGEVSTRLIDALSSADQVAGSLSEVSATLQRAWENYRERFEKVDEDLERAFDKLQTAVEQQQRQVQSFVEQLDASFDTALRNLSGPVDQISSSLEDLSDLLSKRVA